jgi:cell wall-associated NlpC family hydrolase
MHKANVAAALMALTGAIVLAAATEKKPTSDYHSPYKVEFTFPLEELIPDILHGNRADPKLQSRVPFGDWYSESTKKKYGAWGPPRVHHTVPAGIGSKSSEWKRQRVIAVAMRYIGYGYQHHYIPDWDPPADWPWLEVKAGHNGKGTDCSNFTTYVYNLALGLKTDSGIKQQSEMTEATLADGKAVKLERIEKPATHADFIKQLKTGDLVFIKNTSGNVSHVVFWVGPIGKSPDSMPLILDSTGEGRTDANGKSIPDGVQLRPFTPTSWYCKSASHVIRVIP